MNRVRILPAVVVVVVTVALGPACTRSAPMSRAQVTLRGDGVRVAGTGGAVAGAVDVLGAAVVVEEAAAALTGVRSVHTALCAAGAAHRAVVVVDGADATAVNRAVDAGARSRLPAGVQATTDAVADDVAVFAVRADPTARDAAAGVDAFAARDFAERVLRPAIVEASSGADLEVELQGGRRERQVLLDLKKMLAHDLTIPEILFVTGGSASLETTVAKTSMPPLESAPSMEKRMPAPAQPGEVRVMLSDVADIGLLPVGEPLRRDGAIELRVSGDRALRAKIADAAKSVTPPPGIEVALLDDDSVEAVDVIVADTGAAPAAPGALQSGSHDQLLKDLLAIPGVRLGEEATTLRFDVDADRAAKLGVSLDHIHAVVDVALSMGGGRGRTVLRNTENVVVRLGGEVPPELLSQLVVARTQAGPIRLLDVATLVAAPARTDRLDRQPARRVRVLFDVGVRKNALLAVEEVLKRSGAKAIVERRDVAAGLCR